MTIHDLKGTHCLIDQYVRLRNKYAENLLTNYVSNQETLDWLHKKSVVVFVACEGDELVGALVLYIEKEGEIAVFVKNKRRGIATVLLENAKQYAKGEKMKKIWAWVATTNKASNVLFQKNGFYCISKSRKSFSGMEQNGATYMLEIV